MLHVVNLSAFLQSVTATKQVMPLANSAHHVTTAELQGGIGPAIRVGPCAITQPPAKGLDEL